MIHPEIIILLTITIIYVIVLDITGCYRTEGLMLNISSCLPFYQFSCFKIEVIHQEVLEKDMLKDG